MTAQIFLDLINHGIMELRRVNLLIFDECHRGVNDHPMRLIMQRFRECPVVDQPRVLGMSASLLNCNVKVFKIAETLRVRCQSRGSIDYIFKIVFISFLSSKLQI